MAYPEDDESYNQAINLGDYGNLNYRSTIETDPLLLSSSSGLGDSSLDYLEGGSVDPVALEALNKKRELLAEQVRNPPTTQNDAIQSALTAIVPALIGLAAGGKKGLGIGSALGGQGALSLVDQRRKQAIEAAKIEQQGLGSIEQALRLQAREKNIRERQDRAITAQEEANRIRKTERDELRNEKKFNIDSQGRAKIKEYTIDKIGFEPKEELIARDKEGRIIDVNAPVLDADTRKRLTGFMDVFSILGQTQQEIDQKGGWENLSADRKNKIIDTLTVSIKNLEGYGAAFTAPEMAQAKSVLPYGATLAQLWNDPASVFKEADAMFSGVKGADTLSQLGTLMALRLDNIADIYGRKSILNNVDNPLYGRYLPSYKAKETDGRLLDNKRADQELIKRGFKKTPDGRWVK